MVQCRWAQEGFLKGPALLTHLHNELQEADDDAAALLRQLLLAAIQPYTRHVRSWLYSTAAVMPAFSRAGPGGPDSLQALLGALDSEKHDQVG